MLIDFSKEALTVPNNYLGADKKRTIIYKGEKYLLKFSTYNEFQQNSLATSYSNNVFSGYIGSKFFKECGIEAQEVILGTYTDISRSGKEKLYPVVACKDFTGDGYELYEFKGLENSYLEGKSGGKIPSLEDITEIMDSGQGIFGILKNDEAKERYWDTFIIDAVLGNFDRHAGNWGYLYNIKENKAKLAPVYDCGSCLFARASDESFKKFLNSKQEINLRVYNMPFASLTVNEKKVNYYDFISSLKNEECNAALKRMHDKIDINKLHKIIDETPMISDVRKSFYKTITKERYDIIIDKSYRKLLKMEKLKSDPLFSMNSSDLISEPEHQGKNKEQVQEKQNIRKNDKTR